LKQIIQKTCWFVFLAFLAGSCTKEPDQIGTSIIPPTDKLQYGIDTTILLDAYSIVEDSVRTDETSQNILGSYWDPIFGISTAGIYTQLSLPFVGHSSGNTPIIDSAILKLAIKVLTAILLPFLLLMFTNSSIPLVIIAYITRIIRSNIPLSHSPQKVLLLGLMIVCISIL